MNQAAAADIVDDVMESLENCRKEAEVLIMNKKIQLAFFREHKVISFLLGRICEKMEREILELKLQIVGYKYVATSLKVSNRTTEKR